MAPIGPHWPPSASVRVQRPFLLFSIGTSSPLRSNAARSATADSVSRGRRCPGLDGLTAPRPPGSRAARPERPDVLLGYGRTCSVSGIPQRGACPVGVGDCNICHRVLSADRASFRPIHPLLPQLVCLDIRPACPPPFQSLYKEPDNVFLSFLFSLQAGSPTQFPLLFQISAAIAVQSSSITSAEQVCH